MVRYLWLLSCALVTSAACTTTLCTSICKAASPTVVDRITDVSLQFLLSDPPHMVVTAKGLVPSAGFTDTRLLRVRYVTTPLDGIQDYFLVSTAPTTPAAAVITEVSASDQFNEFTGEAPWLKGVRVHGVGSGALVKMLGSNLRVRKNILDLTPTELAAFKQGVQVMKSRPLSDRRSWLFQANIHGENTPLNDPLWNRCQHNTLHFFTWHRAYLLEFERILREASGDDAFNLPYWDWASQRSLPAAFRDATSSLFEPGRTINGGQLLPISIADDLADGLSILNFNGFSFGVEGSPHGSVHVLVGGRMASVPTAANDPIFWLHHCQIDRIWDSWIALGGGRLNPTDPAFLNRTFTFASNTGTTVTHRMGDLLNTVSLGYRYADLSGSSPVPTPPALPLPNMLVSTNESTESADHDTVVASSAPVNPQEAVANTAANPLGLTVERVVLQRRESTLERMQAAVARAAPTSSDKVVIDVVGLKAQETPRFAFTVYLNLPKEKISDEVKRLYRVSTINFFGMGEKHNTDEAHAAHDDAGQAAGKGRQRFDATKTVARLREAGLWNDEELSVTLEPLTPISTKSEDAEMLELLSQSSEKSKITYERIDVSVIPSKQAGH